MSCAYGLIQMKATVPFRMGEKKRNVQRLLDAGNDRCSICWQSLTTNTMATITVEHVPPRSLGGPPACLTCLTCNNRFAEAEEYLRREVRGTSRMSLRDDERRRVLASDVVLPEPYVDENGKKHLDFRLRDNTWKSVENDQIIWSGMMPKMTSVEFQIPDEEELTRAWVKLFYLMAGCARRGEAWRTAWAPKVREYLQGNIPWEQDVGLLQTNKTPLAPPGGAVASCRAAQRSDLFFAAWNEYSCILGLPEKDTPHDRMLDIQWIELGPFVYGRKPSHSSTRSLQPVAGS